MLSAGSSFEYGQPKSPYQRKVAPSTASLRICCLVPLCVRGIIDDICHNRFGGDSTSVDLILVVVSQARDRHSDGLSHRIAAE